MQGAIALDIETTGVNKATDTVTCVALVGKEFKLSWHMGPGYEHEVCRDQLKLHLDACREIYTYNGALFDIPFLQKYYEFNDEEVGSWMRKLMDPFYSAKSLLGWDCCPKLSVVLKLNGISPKISNGGEAIVMAREGRWEELREYCENDTSVTYDLLNRDLIVWVNDLSFIPRSIQPWKVSARQ